MFSLYSNEESAPASEQGSGSKLARMRELMKIVNKKEGGAKLSMVGGDFEIERVTSGILPLDLILGGSKASGYGFPRGKIIEVYGPEHAGKTSVMNALIAKTQAKGGTVLYVAPEDGMDPKYARKFGVKIDEVMFLHPDNAEQAFDTILTFVDSGAVDLVVIDSIIALMPKVVEENDMEKREMGNLARLITTFCNKVQPVIHRTGSIVVAINQLRDNLNYGGGTKTSGGRALKHYAAIRLELKNPGKERYVDPETKEETGIYVTCYTKKNRHNTPFQTARFPLLFASAIDHETNLFLAAKDLGILEKKGSYYRFDEVQFQGQSKFVHELKNNKAYMEKLSDEVVRVSDLSSLEMPVVPAEDDDEE